MSTQAVAHLQGEIHRLRHELRTTTAEEQVPAASEQITIADYLLARLAQLGVTVCVSAAKSRSIHFKSAVDNVRCTRRFQSWQVDTIFRSNPVLTLSSRFPRKRRIAL